MIILTHITSALVIAKFVDIYVPHPYSQELLYGVSVACSLVPDVNVLWHKKMKTHHDDFTHYPIFWTSVGLLSSFISPFFGFLLLSNTLFHLLLDTFGYTIGVKWFMPFSGKEYSFTILNKDKIDHSYMERVYYFIQHPSELKIQLLFNFVFIVLVFI